MDITENNSSSGETKSPVSLESTGETRGMQDILKRMERIRLSLLEVDTLEKMEKDIHREKEKLVDNALKIEKELHENLNKGKGTILVPSKQNIRQIGNVVRDYIRKKTRRKSVQLEDYHFPPVIPVNSDDRMDLEEAIKQLPDGYRLVLVLHDVEGLKHREIAEKLEVSIGTSKKQLFNARKMLREKLSSIKEIQYE